MKDLFEKERHSWEQRIAQPLTNVHRAKPDQRRRRLAEARKRAHAISTSHSLSGRCCWCQTWELFSNGEGKRSGLELCV